MPSYTTGTASLEIDRHALSDNRNSKPVNSNNNETHDTDGVAMLNRNFEQQDTICSQSDFQEDSKQGWLCVAAGWCIFFVYMGLTYSYGIVQLHLANRNFADVPTLSYVGSIAAAISPFGAILTQKIMGRIGYRWSAAIGGTLLGLGEFAAGFSLKSLPGFFITQGVVFGIGAGLCFLVSLVRLLFLPILYTYKDLPYSLQQQHRRSISIKEKDWQQVLYIAEQVLALQ